MIAHRTAKRQEPEIAMHSAASPDWGTPLIGRQLAQRVLAPANVRYASAIDIDYASSAYWNGHWPGGHAPAAFLDGKRGRDVRVAADRHRAMPAGGGTGFENPPGLDRGEMVQACWRAFVEDWQIGMLKSGVWVGFSIEQFASLQNACDVHPLSPNVLTIVPSRRGRYLLHPEQLIALCLRKRRKRDRKSDVYRQLTRQIAELRDRKNDDPVPGDQPTHASYLSLLLASDHDVRERQRAELRLFLNEQSKIKGSWFEKVAIVGNNSERTQR